MKNAVKPSILKPYTPSPKTRKGVITAQLKGTVLLRKKQLLTSEDDACKRSQSLFASVSSSLQVKRNFTLSSSMTTVTTLYPVRDTMRPLRPLRPPKTLKL